MRQYNRIMLGEHGRFLKECIEQKYIGVNFGINLNVASFSSADEREWRHKMIDVYLSFNPDKSIATARNSVGFLWTICNGLKCGDIVLASDGEGCYHVGVITGDYFYCEGENLQHRRPVDWTGVVIQRKSMSKELQNSTGSIGTCCNITKYSEELDRLIGSNGIAKNREPKNIIKPYKDRSLHRLLANYLLTQNKFSKTIFHEFSTKADQAQKWIHPDMVAVEFNEFHNSVTQSFLKVADTKRYVDLYSFELKRCINNDHQLKEYFFQALSNSSWAIYGYLVSFVISEDVEEEMVRLNRAFGIGVIELSPFSDATRIRYQARKNELDYHTIDKLCRINQDFRDFISKTARVLSSQNDVLEDVKNGLQKFCDKGFQSNDDIVNYCKDNCIPC